MGRAAVCVTGFLLVLWAPGAAAHSYGKSDIEIGHVWGWPAPGAEGQVFMPLPMTLRFENAAPVEIAVRVGDALSD